MYAFCFLLIADVQYSLKSDFEMAKEWIEPDLCGNIASSFVISYYAGSYSGAAKVQVDLTTAECTLHFNVFLT